MKVSKAIEILRHYATTATTGEIHDFTCAIKLGIEALERIFSIRPYSNTDRSYNLKGETPEDE